SFSPSSALRSRIATFTPLAASAVAVAAPRPDAPPVTTAEMALSSCIVSAPSVCNPPSCCTGKGGASTAEIGPDPPGAPAGPRLKGPKARPRKARANARTRHAGAAPRLFRHRRRAHLEGPQSRQPDALRARVRRQLHVHDRRELPGAGSARRHVQGSAAPATLQLGDARRSGAAGRVPTGRRGAPGGSHRPAELPPSPARSLCAGPRAGRAVAGTACALRLRRTHSIELLHQPRHGRRHRHVRPRALPRPLSAAPAQRGRTRGRAARTERAQGGAGQAVTPRHVETLAAALAQLDVEGAGAAVAHAGLRVAHNDGPEVRVLEPGGDAAPQNATPALACKLAEPVGRRLATLAGDDQHGPVSLRIGMEKKRPQPDPGLILAQPVKIDARVDLDLAGADLPQLAALELRQRRGLAPARRPDARHRCFARSRRRSLCADLRRRGSMRRRLQRHLGMRRLGHAGLGLDALEGAGGMLPELGLVGGDGAMASAGLLAASAHGRALSRPGSASGASARAGASLGSSTMNLPACFVTPASRPAASPDPKKMSPRSGPLMAEPTSCATISRLKTPALLTCVMPKPLTKMGRPRA